MDSAIATVTQSELLIAAIIALLGIYVRSLPVIMVRFLISTFSTTLSIQNSDSIYYQLDLLLGRAITGSTRRLGMVEGFDSLRGEWDWEFSIGEGYHLLWIRRRPVIVRRVFSDSAGGDSARGVRRAATLSITTIGRSRSLIEHIVSEAKAVNRDASHQRIFYWKDGSFAIADRKRRRELSTVFMPRGLKERLVGDMSAFISNQAEYHRRGDPYRRTYALEGPPGTGKTTLVQAIAAHFERDVYVVSLSSTDSDETLQSALNQIDKNGVGLIEDIDTNVVVRQRADNLNSISQGVVENKGNLTLSGLLNALDGAVARDGRIMFVTSNHLDHLDGALIRPGRIDVVEHIGLMTADDALAMARHYWPSDPALDEWFEQHVLMMLPVVPSSLREMLLARTVGDVSRIVTQSLVESVGSGPGCGTVFPTTTRQRASVLRDFAVLD